MTNITAFPDRERARTEACEWMARLDRGLTAGEERLLAEWISASRVNMAAMEECARLWDRMDSLARLGDLFPVPGRRSMAKPLAASLAAALLLLVMLVALNKGTEPSLPADRSAAAGYQQLFETAVGESSVVALPDGSTLTLNTYSRVRVFLWPERRELRLERGELFIQVAPDPLRPLEVLAEENVVRAVGTAFNVAIKPDRRVEVLVTEGTVMVSARPEFVAAVTDPTPPDLGTSLEAGHLAVLAQSGEVDVATVTAAEVGAQLSWREGNVVFRGQPLGEALEEIERYTAVEFRIEDDAIRAIRVVGLFKAGDVDGLLDSLQQNFDIEYERPTPETILLRGPAAAP